MADKRVSIKTVHIDHGNDVVETIAVRDEGKTADILRAALASVEAPKIEVTKDGAHSDAKRRGIRSYNRPQSATARSKGGDQGAGRIAGGTGERFVSIRRKKIAPITESTARFIGKALYQTYGKGCADERKDNR